jgi:hypothetical protein
MRNADMRGCYCTRHDFLSLASLACNTAVIQHLERKVPVPTLTVLVLVSATVVLG